ncbi:MAG: SGNH/GDSL hydrolase family protein [Candidatus Cloacimonetes bacterium]|nr:SGNH/GDSL hydrolase family protein [Candidatus Cloacimonadota bacterium]
MKKKYSTFLLLLIITIISATDHSSENIFTQKLSILRNNSNSYQNRTPITISCLGNSITNGYPYAGTEFTYPSRLLEMLDTAYGSGIINVINHGVDGHRADEVFADLQNLNWMEQDNPDFVLLIVGGNDLNQGQSIISTVADVQNIINFISSHINSDGSHPAIIVSAMIPNLLSSTLGSTYIAMYNASLVTNLYGEFTWFSDNWDDFYNSSLGTAIPLFMYDDIHPNMDGYDIMAENWFDEVNQLCIINQPQNVSVTINDNTTEITWEAVAGATSYKVYSSTTPNGTFEEDLTGEFDGTNWIASINENKVFYYVTAIVE